MSSGMKFSDLFEGLGLADEAGGRVVCEMTLPAGAGSPSPRISNGTVLSRKQFGLTSGNVCSTWWNTKKCQNLRARHRGGGNLSGVPE